MFYYSLLPYKFYQVDCASILNKKCTRTLFNTFKVMSNVKHHRTHDLLYRSKYQYLLLPTSSNKRYMYMKVVKCETDEKILRVYIFLCHSLTSQPAYIYFKHNQMKYFIISEQSFYRVASYIILTDINCDSAALSNPILPSINDFIFIHFM